MPELHRAGNPFAAAPAIKPRPKHKPGNPFAPPELDTFPSLYPEEEEKKPLPSRWDPTYLSRKVGEISSQAIGAVEGLTTAAGKSAAGLVRLGSRMSPVVASGMLDPTDPQRKDALPKSELMETAAEDLAGNIRKVEKRVLTTTAKLSPPKTTTQKVARAGFNIAGQLAPFVAAGPLGLAVGSGLNVATEVGAEPEESLLGMFSKEQAKSPVKRGAAALAGDVAIGVPLLAGAQALKARKLTAALRARALRDSGLDQDLVRAAEAIPGATPAPEAPVLPPSGPPAAVSRVGAVGNQPRGPLPLRESPRGPVVDLKAYPLAESPAGGRRADAGVRYNRVTKGGRGELVDQSWMDTSPIKDESDLTDKVLSGQQRRLLDLAQEVKLASPSGGIVVDPGHKTAKSITAKVNRMAATARPELSPLQQLGDLHRATIVVEHPSDAGPVIAKLQESGWLKEVEDKFSKPDNLGYGAVHAQLVDPVTGAVNELQIHTPQTFAAVNDLGGHYIYDYLFSKNAKPILTKEDHTEARRLIEYIRSVQGEAHSAAMTGKPLAGASERFRLTMETSPDSPEYGRWYVEEKATRNRVADADNPFKARTVMKELDSVGAHDTKAPATPGSGPVTGPAARATMAPEGPVSIPESAGMLTGDVPHRNPFREPVESKLKGPTGSEDVTFFGQRAVKTRYRVVDSRDVIASNDPHTFDRRGDYPEAIQGRVYHGAAGQGARESVVAGAMGLDARRIVNPTRSIGGPPTLTRDGIVVAGNQRAMMQQRVYDLHPEKAAELKAQVAADAQRAGLNPAELEGIERPVLVREVVDEAVDQADMNQLRELNELSDKVTKKAKDPLREAMGRARQLKANSGALEHYAATSSAEEPLSEYLQGPNGLPFLNKLVEDKVLLSAELDGFRDAATGHISKQGRQKLQEMMSAAAVGDAAIIDAAPAAIVGKLETGTPRLIAAAQTEGWSLEKPLQEALELHTSRVANGQKSIADALAQPDMLGREIAGAKGQALARFLETNTKTKVSDAMTSWSEAAEKARLSDGATDMFGVSAETPDEAFERIFLGRRPVGRVGAVGKQPKGIKFGGAYKGPPDRFTVETKGLREGAGWIKVVGVPDAKPETIRKMLRAQGFQDKTIDAREWRVVPFEEPKKGSIAGPVENDPYNYAALKMLTSMAGTGIGGGAGATAGSKIGATPEERKRNAALGFGIGATAGFVAPFAPEIAVQLASKLRSAGAAAPAKLFQLHATPEIVRLKIAGRPDQAQIQRLFETIRKNPKATFRYSVRDLEGREVGAGRSLGDFATEMTWADSNAPARKGSVGTVDYGAPDSQVSFGPPKAGAVGNQPEHIVQSAIKTPAGKHYTGDWHSDAIETARERDPQAREMLDLDAETANWPEQGWELGFETSKGRFVSREEAFDLAKTAGQEPKYLSTNKAGKPELYSGTYWPKGDRPLAGNRIGATGNQPRPGPRPPTRVERSAYKEPDYVYWPRNSRASVDKARDYLNLAKTGLDKTGEARIKALIASGLDKGTINKGYRSFAEQDLRSVHAKRELLKKLVEDPRTLVGPEKLKNVSTSTIKAMWEIANDNTKVIEAAARVMNNPLSSADEILEAAALHDRAYKQTEELLSSIVTETAQKAREFGALRNIAKQSTDPEVWLVQAKRIMGDRPMPDAVQAQIRKLAQRAQEACR